MNQQADNRIVYLLFAFFAASCFLLLHGYRFNCGDQAEHLPQIYQRFDPQLYPGDFFLTRYHETFPVRFYWVESVYWPSLLLPLPVVCFMMYFLCLWLSVYAWMRISQVLGGNERAPYIAVALILLLNSYTVGANTFAGSTYVASNPAMLFISFALLAFFRARYLVSGLLLGLATLFQALFGLQMWMILLGCLLFPFSRQSLLKSIRFSLMFLLFSTPMLLPALCRQAAPVEGFPDYYQLLFIQRCYLHFIPSLFPLRDYACLSGLVLLAVVCIVRLPLAGSSPLLRLMAMIAAGCVVYWFLLEPCGILSLGKLQWFKSTIWINTACCLLIADSIARASWLRLPDPARGKWAYAVLGILILLVVNNSAALPWDRLRYRYQTGNAPTDDLQKMHEWIRLNTPKNANFLCSPFDDSFGCEAQRPMPVNFKALVFEPFYFKDWKRSMQDYYNVDFAKLGDNPSLAVAEWNYQHILRYPLKNEVTYRLDNLERSSISSLLGPVLHRDGNWILTQIPPTHD